MEQSALPTPLYYYTDVRGLFGIIQDQAIWASNIRYLNDSQEFDYAVTLAKCSGLQTVSDGLANKGDFEPTFAVNMGGLEPTIFAHEPRFTATSLQTAMWTHIRCIQSPEGLTVLEKLGPSLIRTHTVRFIGGYPDIDDRGKGSFSPVTGESCLARRAYVIFAANVGSAGCWHGM